MPTLSVLEQEFLSAAHELGVRQLELVALVADALGVGPYEYWILGEGRADPRLDAINRTRDDQWQFHFHGIEFDAVHLADGRSVRVDLVSPGSTAFTAGGVESFALCSRPPWREFPSLRELLRGEQRDYRLCIKLADDLRLRGLIGYTAPHLVALIERSTRTLPGRGQVLEIPADELPPDQNDLVTCNNLVLTAAGRRAIGAEAV